MRHALLLLTALSLHPAFGFAAGMIPLEPAAYVQRAAEAIEEELARGTSTLAEEFVTLLEEGAYAREAGVRRALTKRVQRALAAAALQPGAARRPLESLVERIRHAASAATAPTRRTPIRLPEDEAGHRRLAEWWYLNGHLTGDGGREFGYELTFFHVRPGIFFVHTALTDLDGKRFHHVRRYLSPSECRISQQQLDVDYGRAASLAKLPDGRYHFDMEVGPDIRLSLDLVSRKATMHVNGDGIIDMPEGTFSWYYSKTRLDAAGTLRLGGREFAVGGGSWMDHQWGNFVTLRIGWDWFALQLEDGTDYNIFCFRKPGGQLLASYVNRLDAQGRLTTGRRIGLDRLSWWLSPHTGHRYVTRYRLTPEGEAPLDVVTLLDDQELPARGLDPAPTYWEGKSAAVREDSAAIRGPAYIEQFPYPSR